MNELLQQIFNLEDPIGRTIVYWIRIFFWVGVINYGIHLGRLVYEYVCLQFVQIKIKKGLDVISPGLLNRLTKSVVIRTGIRLSAIYRRIRDLVNIKQNGGEIDHDVLGDIHAAVASRKAGLSNYILGILIILGLVGTLWGLTTAVIEVQPLLEDIDDLDQLPQISLALQETLKGMGTAFKTTLAGLVTSLGLGALGWFFSLSSSAFLTRFETLVATEIIPYFKQTPESAIESSMDQLQVSVDEFKLATEDNVRRMQESIQQLTEKSWDAYLEQQYVIANELREIPGELRESLGGISEYQVLIKSTVESFEASTKSLMTEIKNHQSTVTGFNSTVESFEASTKSFMTEIKNHQTTVDTVVNDFKGTTEQSMSQVAAYQKTLLDGIENVVSDLKEESKGLKTTIGEARTSHESFIDDANNLTETFGKQLQSMLQPIVKNQQDVVIGLRETSSNISEIAGELQIRSALEKQNGVFQEIKSGLIQNQQETGNRLSQLIGELQIIPALEAQNKVFERIESHLEGQRDLVDEQQELMKTLNSSVNQLQQVFSKSESAEQQHTEKMLQQLTQNFDELGEKIDALNDTITQSGSGTRRWFSGNRKEK